MKVIDVHDRRTARAFLDLPRTIYRDDQEWVCPLDRDISSVFDPRKNNFHSFGVCARWILVDDAGRTIGRIAAFINKKKAFNVDPPTGGCGFFECIDDQQAANLLFDTARDWHIARGIKAMDGPINFGENVMWWGLLIEGFTKPYYGMAYNPPYYRRLFEEYGFKVQYEQISNKIDIAAPFPERFGRIAEWVAKRKENSFRHLEVRNFDKYAKEFMDIYNDGWKDFENFSPVTLPTVMETFEKMRHVMDERLIWYAYVNGDPASFVMVLPDANDMFTGLNGRMHLLGKLRFLWNKLTTKPKRLRAVIMGTKEKYRNLGLESALFIKLKEYVVPLRQYEEMELSWVGDFNTKMMSVHQATGARMSKRHATYRYLFPQE